MRFLRQGGLYKGLLGGSRGWLIVGVVMWSGRLLKRAAGKTEEVVALEELKPGQIMRIEAIPMATKRQRRHAAVTDPRGPMPAS